MNDLVIRDNGVDILSVIGEGEPELIGQFRLVGYKMKTPRGTEKFPEVGFVYPAKGGSRRGNSPSIWVVVNVLRSKRHPDDLMSAKVVMLGINDEGEICSSQTYNAFGIYDRQVLGIIDPSLLFGPREI